MQSETLQPCPWEHEAVDVHNSAIVQAMRVVSNAAETLPQRIRSEPDLVMSIVNLLEAINVRISEIKPDPKTLAALATGEISDAMVEKAKLYDELIYAVATKYEGEPRHETALRYIREREDRQVSGPCQAGPTT